MKRASVALLFVGIILAGCRPEAPPPADLDAARQQIHDANQRWLQAESRQDLDSSLTFIAPDGYYLASDWPTLQGRDAVAEYLEAAFALPQDTILGGPIHIDVAASGEMAYEVGQTDVKYNFASGDTTIKAHYIVVWKKLGGRWQAVATSVSGAR